MKALVVSNCCTAAYTKGLQVLFPDWEVRGVMHPEAERFVSREPKNEAFVRYAGECDIYIGVSPVRAKFCELLPDRAERVIIPPFMFRGLQPDSFHLTGFESAMGKGGSLYSRIVVAAFQAGLRPGETVDLFNSDTYEALGYLTSFDEERVRLYDQFARRGIDLTGCLERWLARGSFLHSYNHPRIDVLMDVLRRALVSAGLLPQCQIQRDDDMGVIDQLARAATWPVYPEVAERHGIQGSMTWRLGQSNQYRELSLEEFVAASFSLLEARPLPEIADLPQWVDRITALRRKSELVDPERGRSVLITAERLWSLGEIDAASQELEMGLPLLKRLAERNPTAFRPILRRALALSAACYRRKGQTVLAMAMAVQEVSTMRLLAATGPADLTIELARSLRRLSAYQLSGGQASAAYIARVEAATVVGQLATANPERYGKEWLDMLSDKLKAVSAAGLFREKKVEALSELLSASAALAAADPLQFVSEQIKILKIARDEVRDTTIQLPIAASLRAARRRHLWVLLAKSYRTIIRKSKRPV